MKGAVLWLVLLNLTLLLACTKVHVEILQPVVATAGHIPQGKLFSDDGGTEGISPRGPGHPDEEVPKDQDPVRRQGSGADLRSDFVTLIQTGGKSCATDLHETRPVAQKTDVWCWAASVEGVMSFHNMDLPQCGSVNKIVGAGTVSSVDKTPLCCRDELNGICQRNGWTDQVFDAFNIYYEWLPGSLSKQGIARQICGNGPFTFSTASDGGGGHTFVVKDFWGDTNEMSLLVDEHEYFLDDREQRIPAGFKTLSYEAYAQGWYNQTSHKVDFTYVRIKPQD